MTSDDILVNFVSSDSYTIVNDNLVKGLEGDAYSAFILSKFITLFRYFYSNDLLTHGGYFFQTIDTLETSCGITESRQRSALKLLESKGLIDQRLFGSPPRRHFKLNSNAIVELFGVRMKEEKKAITVVKEDFYDLLNDALNMSWMDTQKYGDNIDKRLLWFMYTWCYNYRVRCEKDYHFTPKLYGELRTYWRGRYNKKEFDYGSLYDYYLKGDYDRTISLYDFINFDRARIEKPYNEQVLAKKMTLRNDDFDETFEERYNG